MLTYHEAQTMMARAQDRGYGPRRKLQNHTYLYQRGDDFAVRLHYTDVVIIHADGTYTLDTGTWRTVTTKERINGYGPARVYSHRGIWCVWTGTDPRTPANVRKCRTCHGTGEVTVDEWGIVTHYETETQRADMHERDGQTYPCSRWFYDWEKDRHRPLPLPLQRNGRPLRDQPEHTAIVGQVSTWLGHAVTGHHQTTCRNCNGAGRADYGSRPNPVVFTDGMRVSSDGTAIDQDGDRLYDALAREAEYTRELRKIAAERLRRERLSAAERVAEWLAENNVTVRENGTVILYKAVGENLVSQHGTAYPIGATVTADDYTADPGCGHGLHFCATPAACDPWTTARDRYLACAVDRDSLIMAANDAQRGSGKVKARSCTVLYEVSRDGLRRIRHSAWDDLPGRGTAGRD
jgi:hypothetical protein